MPVKGSSKSAEVPLLPCSTGTTASSSAAVHVQGAGTVHLLHTQERHIPGSTQEEQGSLFSPRRSREASSHPGGAGGTLYPPGAGGTLYPPGAGHVTHPGAGHVTHPEEQEVL